jgi:hypothetical protein
MRLLILLITLFLFGTAQAQQKHDNIWLFGAGYYRVASTPTWVNGGMVMDFATFPPNIALQDFPIHKLFKAHAIACDGDGTLVAYTNGCDVVDDTHQLMLGGDTLQPDIFSTYFCGMDGQYPSNQECTFLPDF